MKHQIHLIVIIIACIFQVNDYDTLEKVALRFNSTPSELRQLNKLTTRTVFPGQVRNIIFI
jgi:LysM repeat protein